MNVVAASEIKRRGIGVVDQLLERGPVHVIKNNHLGYVVISEEDFQQMLNDIFESRLAASDTDIKLGRIHRGTLKKMMSEIEKEA